ncbi:gamma-glutamyl-CDP-amidate hydrolase [Campylobacter armoricus]|uniref:gamma-glutamyl-CDP-amidate hydrolase n=1 Tax=Campylobacter armoricus TaxID=2505970 RepID=UPI0011174778|nr:gamma-glutamyl-CDP-amidate hydrolase [Campylobacter armoricus]
MKFIAISQRILENQDYYELRECLALDWGNFFKKELNGFLPLPLSYEIDFKNYIPYISAVILSGGNDLSSCNFSFINQKRDEYEINIIKHCLQNNISLLGICKGAQMIASYFNSTICPCKEHVGNHDIYLKNQVINVNSYHNFAITKLSDELEVIASAKDNTIEAFKHKKFNIYGLMWHIERENKMNEKSIFNAWLKSIK